jgi:Flp pilus assembly protein TadG
VKRVHANRKFSASAAAAARRWRADTGGNVAMLFGFAAIVLFACVGAATDYGRWVSAHRQTQYAVDAAVLAASRVAQMTGDTVLATAAANDYYAKMKSEKLLRDAVVFTPGATATDFAVTGTGAVATPFLSFIGISELAVKPKAAATIALGGLGDSNLEISLMLDITGSMCPGGAGPCTSGPKMDGLKKAAKDLIDIVVWADQSQVTSRVALVPFSTRIRVGQDGSAEGANLMKKITNLDATWSGYYNMCTSSTGGGGSEGGGDWKCLQYTPTYYSNWKIMPCVTDRFRETQWDNGTTLGTDDREWDLSDDAPGSHYWLNAHGADRMPVSRDSRDITPSHHAPYHTSDPAQRGLILSDPASHWNYNQSGDCADVANSNSVMPLTSDRAALAARIDGLSAYGSTAGAQASQWSWYMLSPKWKNIWTGSSEPGQYSDMLQLTSTGQPKLKKIAVLLTDGVYNTVRGDKGGDPVRMSNYAQKVCREMRAAGITIYTIGFGLNELPLGDQALARTTLEQCATSHKITDGTLVYNFYNAQTVGALQTAFRDIGLQLSKLRLTE